MVKLFERIRRMSILGKVVTGIVVLLLLWLLVSVVINLSYSYTPSP